MKPPWFDYEAPATLGEALAILKAADDDGRVLAGGQSLMPMLNMRIVDPAVLVDINRIPELDRIEEEGDTLCVGALVRHVDLLKSEIVRSRWVAEVCLNRYGRAIIKHVEKHPEKLTKTLKTKELKIKEKLESEGP